MITIDVMANGNIVLTPDDKQSLIDMHNQTGDDLSILCEALEHYSTNGSYTPVSADQLGGLSQAPCIVESVDITDDGDLTPEGRVWWFPDYMIRNPIKEIIEDGYVIFHLADKGA